MGRTRKAHTELGVGPEPIILRLQAYSLSLSATLMQLNVLHIFIGGFGCNFTVSFWIVDAESGAFSSSDDKMQFRALLAAGSIP